MYVQRTYVTGEPLKQVFGHDSTLFLGSDFGKILYMCGICSGQVGKDPWELLLKWTEEDWKGW